MPSMQLCVRSNTHTHTHTTCHRVLSMPALMAVPVSPYSSHSSNRNRTPPRLAPFTRLYLFISNHRTPLYALSSRRWSSHRSPHSLPARAILSKARRTQNTPRSGLLSVARQHGRLEPLHHIRLRRSRRLRHTLQVLVRGQGRGWSQSSASSAAQYPHGRQQPPWPRPHAVSGMPHRPPLC